MAVNPSPLGGPKPQFLLATGLPAVGGLLFWYVAGSVNTKQSTYTDSTGGSANTNPIVLNALGEPTTEIWLTAGSSYKAVLAPAGDTDPPTSPIWSIDNLRGINDTTIAIDEWVSSGITPTFVSTTSFTLPGDQTSNFHINRRLKFTVTAGTVYGTIATSVFGALTTVTMTMNAAQVLDSGLTAVLLGLLRADNVSIPQIISAGSGVSIAWTSGKPTISASLGTQTVPRLLTNADFAVSLSGNAATIALKGSDGNDPSTTNVVSIGFRSPIIASGISNSRTVTAALSTVISSGSTGGTVSTQASRIWVAAIDTVALGGTTELAWFNSLSGTTIAAINEGGLITTTAEGGAGAADSSQTWYSTTARVGVPFVILGYFDSTQTTAGNWAQAITSIVINPVKRPGDVVQEVMNSTGASATGTTAFPNYTDTAPTNAQGDQYVSQAITPTSAANIGEVEMLIYKAHSAAAGQGAAIYQDSSAAVATGWDNLANGFIGGIKLFYRLTFNTTASTTFKVRAGGTTGATMTFNGAAGSRVSGGTMSSYLKIKEIFV